MGFWSLVLAFAPWILFKIIILIPLFGVLTMVKLGIVIAAIVCAYQAYTGLHKGVILYGGILFFGFSLITVVLFGNIWVTRHLGVLSHGTLAGLSWLSILLRRPFTMDYAKQYIPEQLWTTQAFILKNNIITGIWAVAFSINLADAVIKIYHPGISGMLTETIDNAAMLLAIIITVKMTHRKPTP